MMKLVLLFVIFCLAGSSYGGDVKEKKKGGGQTKLLGNVGGIGGQSLLGIHASLSPGNSRPFPGGRPGKRPGVHGAFGHNLTPPHGGVHSHQGVVHNHPFGVHSKPGTGIHQTGTHAGVHHGTHLPGVSQGINFGGVNYGTSPLHGSHGTSPGGVHQNTHHVHGGINHSTHPGGTHHGNHHTGLQGGHTSGTAECRYFCKTRSGSFYCCEKDTEPAKPVCHKRIGSCPPVRPSCPPTKTLFPQTCSNDCSCNGTDKCCLDTCLGVHVCKPVITSGPYGIEG